MTLKHWIRGRLPIPYLALAALAAIGGLFLLQATSFRAPRAESVEQLRAARIMAASLAEIKQLRASLGIPIDRRIDPNETGMIGEEFTELTTSLGDLEAKRTTANPDFAALMVTYFRRAGLRAGDTVAIGASGSFPSLIVATLAACNALELKPVLIYSVGASMYGANIPQLTFIPMLKRLNESGILPYGLAAVSMGGDGDRAEGMFFETSQNQIRGIAQSSGVVFIHEQTVARTVRRRMDIYRRAGGGRPPRCFVNVGGATPNYGNTSASQLFPNGLVLHPPVLPQDPERGLIFEYAAMGIPVINLINVKGLALRNGLPFDPVPMPPPGRSQVYFVIRYNRVWPLFLMAVITAVVVLGTRAGRVRGRR